METPLQPSLKNTGEEGRPPCQPETEKGRQLFLYKMGNIKCGGLFELPLQKEGDVNAGSEK